MYTVFDKREEKNIVLSFGQLFGYKMIYLSYIVEIGFFFHKTLFRLIEILERSTDPLY